MQSAGIGDIMSKNTRNGVRQDADHRRLCEDDHLDDCLSGTVVHFRDGRSHQKSLEGDGGVLRRLFFYIFDRWQDWITFLNGMSMIKIIIDI
jgi:hypothetical protein